ncbi:hypothetical protein P167DRAFT_342794 [Morchella conica CCBAS932]|uniref:Mmc1 C-terminal domain-containing protein n=1 Tax=Morchella conica CCBAS932 TaxID=1392247 RepID=A0A3N4KRN6_9PEZI|nr:hypothetical protein P167DRAFT_342794 [Morchella conica CCBAS932]
MMRGLGLLCDAVLGRSGSEGRLVAVLLADPLSTELEVGKEQWVKEILTWSSACSSSSSSSRGAGGATGDGGGRALLIRYGPPTNITTPTGSPISLLSVPSPLLRSSALEILLAPLPYAPPEDLTVVALKATEIPGARVIEYPVHKTLVWAGEGSDGLSTLLNQKCSSSSTGRVLKALSLPVTAFSSAAHDEGDVKIVDLKIAEDAIAQLEESTLYASTFQREMLQSGIEKITKWITDGTHSGPEGAVKPVVKELAYSIISEAEVLLRKEEDEILAAQTAIENRASVANSSSAPKADTFGSLSRALKSWSQYAHEELQGGLDAAFKTKPWNDLAWWKLIWATDDVSSNTRDVLAAGFLTDSKKKLLFLAGRFSGAGYHGDGKGTTPAHAPTSVEEELAFNLGNSDANTATNVDLDAGRRDGKYIGGPKYSPPFIAQAVGDIVRDMVPVLQSSANRLLLKSASLSASGALVSAMLYALEISVYSSLSATAVAVVYSARLLQTKWERERGQFQDAVMERGRVAIAKTERWGWDRLREGVKVEEHGTIEDEGLKRINDGKKIIESVRSALEKV